jgi:acyl carrier protein
MSADPSLLASGDLGEVVRRTIADVLMVPLERVRPDTPLVAGLGAESIDFIDLVFHLEEALRRQIPIAHWTRFVEERLRGRDLATAITAEFVREFAEWETAR